MFVGDAPDLLLGLLTPLIERPLRLSRLAFYLCDGIARARLLYLKKDPAVGGGASDNKEHADVTLPWSFKAPAELGCPTDREPLRDWRVPFSV